MATPLNPKTKTFEWMGPPGAAIMVLGLPIAVWGLNAVCDVESCSLADAQYIIPRAAIAFNNALPLLPTALALEVAWFVLHCIMYVLPIGARVQGLPLRTGQSLTYNINGIHTYVLCHVGAFAGHFFGLFDLGELARMFMPLALAAIILSSIGAVALYALSFRSSKVLLALGGNSGNPFYDFWVGRELNPRLGALDFKFMCELRPGLIGWSLLNWAFVAEAHTRGALQIPLILVAIFQSWYVCDAFVSEAGNCSMMDIVHDGFGFMLCFGDHAWVPFLYTLQAKALNATSQKEGTHPMWYIALCVGLHILGYSIFRNANSEKDRFRRDPRDPRVAHLKVMKTSAGKSLIISGHWGVCRHPNYVGDWLMTVAWSMLAGGYLLPYFQPIYFAILLIHRQLRDEEQMLHKYGKEDWEKYCKHVPWRLIPYVY